MAASHKFAALSAEEVEEKQRSLQNKSTKSKEKTAIEQFKAYLQWAGKEDLDFFNFPEDKLDTYLSTFWFNVHSNAGELYKVKTLEGIRYLLNRALKDHGAKFDITSKSSTFQTSICAFEDAKKELKKEEKGTVTHRPEITPQGKWTQNIFFTKKLWSNLLDSIEFGVTNHWKICKTIFFAMT